MMCLSQTGRRLCWWLCLCITVRWNPEKVEYLVLFSEESLMARGIREENKNGIQILHYF